jgi:hypothetical protein
MLNSGGKITVKSPFKVFYGGVVELNTRLRKILNGGNLALRLLTFIEVIEFK